MSDAPLTPLPPKHGPEHSEESEAGTSDHAPETHGETPGQAHGSAPNPYIPAALATDNMIHVDPYEGAWIRISLVVLVVFFIAIVFSSSALGFQVPGVYQRIDPATLMDAGSPFANPELRELAPGKYEVYIRAQIWSFVPGEIHVPAGSTVTFYATSLDVQHGVRIAQTNVNMMILPGQVSVTKATFHEPGTFNFVCHEYCGMLHHTMYGRIVVDPEPHPESLPEDEGSHQDLFSRLLALTRLAQ